MEATRILDSLRRMIISSNVEASEAIRRKDAAAMAEWFARDALFFQPNLPALEGRDAIRHYYADAFSPAVNLQEGTFATSEVHAAGDLGIETGTSIMTWQASGKPAVTVAGKYLTVWKRQPNGSWRIWRHAPSTNS